MFNILPSNVRILFNKEYIEGKKELIDGLKELNLKKVFNSTKKIISTKIDEAKKDFTGI